MEVVIEQEIAPLVVSGRLGDVAFWFRERHGMWQLHRGGHDGPLIADSEAEGSLVEVVRLIHDRLDRAIRAGGCEHEAGGPFCPRCGSRLPPLADAST